MPTNREGFEEFYHQNEPKLYRALLATTGKKELAEDVTQHAFVLACASWETLYSPRAWVWRVAHNCLTQWWEQQNHEVLESSLPGGFEMIAETSDLVAPVTAEDDPDLRKVFADLSPRQRAVMAGRYILGLRATEVAEALGISSQAESEYHRRALLAMRERLEDWRTNG